jgi:hypothetical protein
VLHVTSETTDQRIETLSTRAVARRRALILVIAGYDAFDFMDW